MTRTTPELAPFSELPLYTSGRTFDHDGCKVHQIHVQGGSSVESDIESGTSGAEVEILPLGHCGPGDYSAFILWVQCENGNVLGSQPP
ncbi:hypothetical protein AVEN_222325-1 [Araneus ventricosus]|uniref:Uncharacterized protein n=1 Tax=Araneus ventricosus TaxID=182803 RepID=A0A4Y2EVR4_ARAVE|nr:hypothetical protein AVEN_222325-1 [Araneus ventricosus]